MDSDAIQVGPLLTQAYRKSGALKHAGQQISPSEMAEAMFVANMMLNAWKIDRLLVIYYKRQVVSVVSGQKDYSVGPGQDWDMERVERLAGAGYLLQPETTTESELPVELVVSYEQYQNIVSKRVTTNYPLVLYYKSLVHEVPGVAPTGIATLWPTPNQAASMAIYWPVTLDKFTDPEEIVYMPKGYQEAILYNLAVRIHQNYPGSPMDGTVPLMATSALERVRNMQMIPLLATSDPASLGTNAKPYWYGYPKAWTPYGTSN